MSPRSSLGLKVEASAGLAFRGYVDVVVACGHLEGRYFVRDRVAVGYVKVTPLRP